MLKTNHGKNEPPIQVGEKYKNRFGVILTVIKELSEPGSRDEKFLVIDETKTNYYHPGWSEGYFVNKFGRFGYTPNPRDLIEITS